MQKRAQVKIILYDRDQKLLVKAADLLVEAFGDQISMSSPRRSRDLTDYHVIAYIELEAGQRGD
jgi:hypothetical protein